MATSLLLSAAEFILKYLRRHVLDVDFFSLRLPLAVLDSSDILTASTSFIPNINYEKPVADVLQDGSLGAWLQSFEPVTSGAAMAAAVTTEGAFADLLASACASDVGDPSASTSDQPSPAPAEDACVPPPAKRPRLDYSDQSSAPSPSSDCPSSPGAPPSARYQERRRKNNIAAKRSRETRRAKDVENEQLVVAFREENEQLRQRKAEMEAEIEKLKKQLMERLRCSKN